MLGFMCHMFRWYQSINDSMCDIYHAMYILTSDNQQTQLSTTLTAQSLLFTNMDMECEFGTTPQLSIDKQRIESLEVALKDQEWSKFELKSIFDLVNMCDFLCIDSMLPILLSNLIMRLNTFYLKTSKK